MTYRNNYPYHPLANLLPMLPFDRQLEHGRASPWAHDGWVERLMR